MEEPNNNNENLEEQMNCKKEEHFNQQFLFFKFSEKIDDILQCMSCIQEDPQVDKKIIIDQILKFPIYKIKNFPPQKNQKDSAEIRRILENFTKEKIEQFKNQVKDQIVEYYKKINNDLNLALQQSQKDKEFECEQKCKTVLNLELKQKEILNQIENLKEQLNKKVDIFQEKIQIKTDSVKNIQNQEKNNNSKNHQSQEMNNQQQIQFYNYEQNAEIEIKNNTRRIEIDNKTIKKVQKVISENLDKNKTYHFKMKINFHEQYNQNIVFYLIGSNDKNTNWLSQNYIYINTSKGACGAACGVHKIVVGQRFADFWEDDKTILNLVFNYKEISFEIYDDQKKGYIKNVIDQNKIKGEQVVLGIRFWQNHCNKIDLSIIDVRAH
ncbi:hypothetical protein PPERSA_09082 [Pseudocohnilembus persalinus]|uniref:Uncharacterized protein n=1 Tax=Pseudocohnilembus persalinus TaxID=266149 RepID=A0A0V0Q7G5_PSEPJ|nr:hypothetical protein PPERSA_09082 [Pseudocohnilembus persalinus]|eukprot:KRW98142.1 hypothetical protein PPERSA_09082 [Pseudocohnilembus persalinus]